MKSNKVFFLSSYQIVTELNFENGTYVNWEQAVSWEETEQQWVLPFGSALTSLSSRVKVRFTMHTIRILAPIFYEVQQITVVAKGQLISKCLFGVFNFLQKTNENKSTWGFIVVK